MIEIDEAALREGLPLRKSQWADYLRWAVESFRITANGVADETQIHTHMCYSKFNDIIADITGMDSDVITIEISRSDMELLDAFDDFNQPEPDRPRRVRHPLAKYSWRSADGRADAQSGRARPGTAPVGQLPTEA